MTIHEHKKKRNESNESVRLCRVPKVHIKNIVLHIV